MKMVFAKGEFFHRQPQLHNSLAGNAGQRDITDADRWKFAGTLICFSPRPPRGGT